MIENNMGWSSKLSVKAYELLTTHQMYAADAATIEKLETAIVEALGSHS